MRSSYQRPQLIYQVRNRNNGSPAWVGDPISTTKNHVTQKSDVVKVVDWKAKIKAGEDASTVPYSAVARDVKLLKGATGRTWRLSDGSSWREVQFRGIYGGLGGADSFAPTFFAHELDPVRTKAYSRFTTQLRQKRQQMSGMVFLAEFREVCQLIRKPATAIDRFFKVFLDKTHKVRRAAKARTNSETMREFEKVTSAQWLELNFAIKPLVADCKNLGEAIAAWGVDRMSGTIRGSANDQWVTTLSGSRIQMTSPIWVWGRVCGSHVREARYTVYGKLRASAELPQKYTAARLLQTLGFNLEEFVPTVWEVIPFSFVIDYFSNVGQLLSLHSTDLSWVEWTNETQILASTSMRRMMLESDVVTSRLTQRVGDTMFGSLVENYKSMNRIRADFSDFPVSFKLPGSPNQYANLGALLVQLAGS
jgi:hypothetical protein